VLIVKSFPKQFGIAARERWMRDAARQAANPDAPLAPRTAKHRGNIPEAVASYPRDHKTVYKPSAFTSHFVSPARSGPSFFPSLPA
jgi:hypothetical protein